MNLPGATTNLSQTASTTTQATKLLTVLAAVPLNANSKPWMVGNAASLYGQNGYSPAVDFVADYISKTKLPVLFVPMPIAAPGVVGRIDQTGNTNTAVVSVSVGGSGSLEELDGQVRVNTGGVVGTDQIMIDLSLDGGRSWKLGIRLGTATSYTIPYVGHVLSFASGSLTAGDVVLKYHSTAPMWDNAGLTAAKVALESQQLQSRGWYVEGPIASSTVAGYVTTAVNAYQSEDDRSLLAKCALPDRLPYATLSHTAANMVGMGTITFALIGETITRSLGSFLTDGFVAGDTIRVHGSAHNDAAYVPSVVAAGSLTVSGLTNEGPILGVTITSEPTITFVDGGSGTDSITRNRGSFLADGFVVGVPFSITGTASNNYTATPTNVTASTITLTTGTVTAETIGSSLVTMTAGQTDSQYGIAMNAAFASVASQDRIDLGAGRLFTLSPFLGFYLRRNVQYFDTIRSYQHDIHIATWQVDNGALDGADLTDGAGNLVEHDERVNPWALSAGFTCARTWANKGAGAYIARSVTRADLSTVLSATENMYVACLAQTVAQAEATNCIGKNLVLKLDGSGNATPESLSSIADKINSALARNLLADLQGEGQRASGCSVTLAANDDLRPVDATLNGVVALNLNGKIAHLALSVAVNPGV